MELSRKRSDTVGEPTLTLQGRGFLRRHLQDPSPSKKTCVRQKFRHFWVRQQYPVVCATGRGRASLPRKLSLIAYHNLCRVNLHSFLTMRQREPHTHGVD